MITTLPLRFTLPLLACLLLSGQQALAANRAERWYQVELLVFSNEFATTTEQWEPTPVLAYPNAARFLIEPQRVQANSARHPGRSEVDEFGRQIITLPPELQRTGPEGTTDRQAHVPGPNDPAAAQAPGGAHLQRHPTPFVALPPEQREFRGKAAYMQRSGRYRTLFHETWAQPVGAQAGALPLVLDRSGDTGQWPRLQGSVKLYLSRYLHIETNLWLNTSGDYLPGLWRMPPAPLGPPSLIIEPMLDPEDTTGQWNTAVEQMPTAATGATGVQPQPEQTLEPIYPYRHAVLLRQKRRMRSTEVHYIDHPLLGIVVKLTPLDREELQIMAEAERQARAGMNQSR